MMIGASLGILDVDVLAVEVMEWDIKWAMAQGLIFRVLLHSNSGICLPSWKADRLFACRLLCRRPFCLLFWDYSSFENRQQNAVRYA